MHSDSMEDSDDNGFSTFLKIHSVLEVLLGKEKKMKILKLKTISKMKIWEILLYID